MGKGGLVALRVARGPLAVGLSLLMAWPSLLMASAILWLAPAAINPAWAAPQDGKVVSGQAGIGQDGKTTTITPSRAITHVSLRRCAPDGSSRSETRCKFHIRSTFVHSKARRLLSLRRSS